MKITAKRYTAFLAHASALGLALCSGTSASAAILSVKSIVVTSQLNSWLQVAEVAANAGGTNVAAAAAGATASNVGGVWSGVSGAVFPSGPFSGPGAAIDGVTSGSYPLGQIFNPAVETGTSLTITLATLADIDSFQIYGRSDCCSSYDRYGVAFLAADGSTIHSITLNADNPDHFAAAEFPIDIGTASAVPEPGTWALMITGLGALAAGLRGRRRQSTAGICTAH